MLYWKFDIWSIAAGLVTRDWSVQNEIRLLALQALILISLHCLVQLCVACRVRPNIYLPLQVNLLSPAKFQNWKCCCVVQILQKWSFFRIIFDMPASRFVSPAQDLIRPCPELINLDMDWAATNLYICLQCLPSRDSSTVLCILPRLLATDSSEC